MGCIIPGEIVSEGCPGCIYFFGNVRMRYADGPWFDMHEIIPGSWIFEEGGFGGNVAFCVFEDGKYYTYFVFFKYPPSPFEIQGAVIQEACPWSVSDNGIDVEVYKACDYCPMPVTYEQEACAIANLYNFSPPLAVGPARIRAVNNGKFECNYNYGEDLRSVILAHFSGATNVLIQYKGSELEF